MRFGGWIPLDEAPAAAPDVPGLLQARADAVLAYPRGRSAMILYGRCQADETLRRYVAGRGAATLGHAVRRGARWIRFGASVTPDVDGDRLLRQFVDRFGAPPAANADV